MNTKFYINVFLYYFMETSFILLILGFLVVTYLIFKFIKKIVFAVFSFIFLIILIIGGIFGLVYLDINNLANTQDFDINLVYGNSENAQFGIVIPFENHTPNIENVTSYNVDLLTNVDLNNVEPNFYIFMSKDLFDSLLVDDSSYYLIGTEDLEYSGFSINASLTKDQVKNLLSSSSAIDMYVDIIYAQNDFPEIGDISAKPLIKAKIEEELGKYNLDFKEALFVSILASNLQNDNTPGVVLKLVEGFKSNELEVYEERFTFKLVKLIPTSIIMNLVDGNI